LHPAARDTKVAVGRELTKSNSLSALGKEKIRGLFCFNHDKGRSCLDLESEQAIRDHEICTLTWTLSYTLTKTADRLILRPIT
jgi:hypothetical protein